MSSPRSELEEEAKLAHAQAGAASQGELLLNAILLHGHKQYLEAVINVGELNSAKTNCLSRT